MTDPLKTVTVGLLWHTFGHGNLGVDALARGHAQLLRQAAERAGVDLRLVSLGAGQTDAMIELPSELTIGPDPSLKRMARGDLSFVKAVRGCDLVFDIGEGDSFTDIYGRRRFILQTASKFIVQSLGKPLYLAPQTIGPFDDAVNRKIAVALMHRSAGVFARDGLSTAFLKANGVTANIDEFIDVAFALPFERQARAGDRTRVGLNVSGLLYNGGYSGRNELGMTLDYAAFTYQVIERLLARPATEVHLISHVHGPGEDADNDAPVMQRLAARYPTVTTAPLFQTSYQAKGYLSGMDLVVAGRMHACIGAFSTGTPVVPVAYSRKFNGLFGTIGYGDYIDGKAQSTDEAVAKVMSAVEDQASLAEGIRKGLLVANERLERYIERLAGILARQP